MALSDSRNFSLTCNEIINDALREIRVLGVGETVSADMLSDCRRRLNTMLKAWQNRDLGGHIIQVATLFLEDNAQYYDLYESSSSHIVTSYNQQDVYTAGSEDDTNIIVDDGSDCSASDVVGVQLDGNTLQWTTCASKIATNNIGLADALTDDVAADNIVYWYDPDDFISLPLDVLDAVYADKDNLNERIMEPVSWEQYQSIATKTSEGDAICYHVQKLIDRIRLWVWPTMDDCTDKIRLTLQPVIDDLDSVSNHTQFPSNWYDAIVLSLATKLHRRYKGDRNIQDLRNEAHFEVMNAALKDNTTSSFQIGVARR